jgi:hypothetical protein
MARHPVCQALAVFASVLVAASIPGHAQALSFPIPRSLTSFTLAGHPVTIVTAGQLSGVSRDSGHTVFKLGLTADLSDLQANLFPLLRSELDRSDPCGDRIAVQHATMVPAVPASLIAVDLHVERWICAKVLGKQVTTKLIGGDGSIQLKVVPEVTDHVAIHLVASVQAVNADGPLADLLRTGPVGSMVRDKINATLGGAVQNGTRLTAALPPPAQPFARLERVEFRDDGGGRLAIALDGTLRVSDGKLAGLLGQLNPH